MMMDLRGRQPGRRTRVFPLRHIPSGSVTRVLRERPLHDERDVGRYPTRGYQRDPPSKTLPASRLRHALARRTTMT